jgi:hypothetical protein
MAKTYSRDSLITKAMKPRKEIVFLLHYSKALSIVKAITRVSK